VLLFEKFRTWASSVFRLTSDPVAEDDAGGGVCCFKDESDFFLIGDRLRVGHPFNKVFATMQTSV
jgi:hypothetical protein